MRNIDTWTAILDAQPAHGRVVDERVVVCWGLVPTYVAGQQARTRRFFGCTLVYLYVFDRPLVLGAQPAPTLRWSKGGIVRTMHAIGQNTV